MADYQLLKGQKIDAPLWSEPVEIIEIRALGARFEVFAKLLSSEKLDSRVLDEEALQVLVAKLNGTATFGADPEIFLLGVEAHRIKLGYTFDPYFAVWASRVDPLPHQLEAVYGVLLRRPKVRFLLADDPGAGKTIMAGLFLKELKYRGMLKRILIVTPANLTDQWRRELKEKFNEDFVVANRKTTEAYYGQTIWQAHTQVITSLDFAKRKPYIDELRSTSWDLVIVDEAHKLSATRYGGEIRRSQRYRLGEVLAKTATHLLFLTATPHQGDPEKFRLLLELLEPNLFASREILEEAARAGENLILLRRLKEDMTDFDGKPLFPPRHVHTPAFRLSPSEQRLYQRVTEYVRKHFNRALDERKRNVGLAMTVLQRRLASSTNAVAASLENRLRRLERLKEEAIDYRGRLEQAEGSPEELEDLTEEERWKLEDELLKLTLAKNLPELEAEIEELKSLAKEARTLARLEDDTKLKELFRILQGLDGEKLLVFTEHRDTLHFLVDALQRRGYKVTYIEGGMRLEERVQREREFRSDAQVMVATEAAGEGINLQFCSVMVNYDLPWNPTRLEQRMGRIHRYGQKYEVHIYNLVAENTREGEVLGLLLRKLEAMREHLGSDRVYDVVGELLAGVDLERLILEHIAGRKRLSDIRAAVEARLDPARIERLREITLEALAKREIDLSRLRDDLKRSQANRLEPEYTERFFVRALERLGGKAERRRGGRYQITLPTRVAEKKGVPRSLKGAVFDPKARFEGELLAPGHPVFDAVLDEIVEIAQLSLDAGAVLESPHVQSPSGLAYFQLGVRNGLGQVVARRLIAVRQGSTPQLVPANILVDARPPVKAAALSVDLELGKLKEWVYREVLDAFLEEVMQEQRRELAIRRKYGLKSLDYLIAESSKKLAELKLRAEKGEDLALVIHQENEKLNALVRRKDAFLEELARAEQLSSEVAENIALAWLLPQAAASPDEGDPAIREQVEKTAMRLVFEYERRQGRTPRDVSQENLGYDIESSGRFIEVKGKAGVGPVTLTPNEWFTARHLAEEYYLYIVVNALTSPTLYVIQNPAAKLHPGEEVGVVRYKLPWEAWRSAAEVADER